ncbi:asparagine synthase (glutamine-hydrolyzing) [Kitasatospora nipponensis]|uniref:asparagine synthase (glutamine-hydrolyzing) n=1 Tax=Kitasatospora nipponensis TaxID=258049 RepID=A0ABN1WEM6_9ACTN
MPGITGWVDHRRDLTREGHAAATMAAQLVARGRHREGRWVSRGAVLGVRSHDTDPGDGRPALAQLGGRPLAVVFDGYLQNADALRAELTDGAAVPRTDAELVLAAYLAWGIGAAERLDGFFAFALWDGRSEELLLCRDRFGVKPLSYLGTPDGLLFASEPAAIAAHPLVRPELDADGLCAVLAQVRAPGHGVLRGVREVRPAHLLRFRATGVSEHRYWELTAAPHTQDLTETIATARELLLEAIARDTVPDAAGGPATVLLSGGLDSSALTALVGERTGRAPRTFTVSFGDSSAPVPDRPFAQAVVDLLGCEHREVLVEAEELTDPLTTAAVLAGKDHPSPFGDKNITPYLFYRQVAEHTPVALSGEAADAVFGGLITEQEREATGHETFPWIERAQAFGMPHGIGNGLFEPGLLAKVGFSAFCAERFQEARAEVPHLPGARSDDRRAREIDYLHMTRLYEQAVNHSERLGTAAGLQIRFPFSDHRLFGYLYNVPWRMKSFDGRDKSLLRQISRDLLPASVLDRPKVPFPITYHRGYKQALADRLRDLLDDPGAPVLPLLDRAAARRMAQDPRLFDRGGWLGRADAEMVLQLDAWLRRLRVGLAW